MSDDPIVEEVHRIREEILAEYENDLHRLIVDAQRRTQDAARGGRRILPPGIAPSPERPETRKAG